MEESICKKNKTLQQHDVNFIIKVWYIIIVIINAYVGII